ncbi:hypothetical protein PoB_006912400 [Plakobranchus ocellatus]|uniref:Uncharacterized protein n=1 Tax=Plakobranchus ocellatus TaxID=259542 RepID=A0AAV4DEH4_9GAST|nr:hypothetical protein PoB_006912400 [Plakobranchus ocellatus]
MNHKVIVQFSAFRSEVSTSEMSFIKLKKAFGRRRKWEESHSEHGRTGGRYRRQKQRSVNARRAWKTGARKEGRSRVIGGGGRGVGEEEEEWGRRKKQSPARSPVRKLSCLKSMPGRQAVIDREPGPGLAWPPYHSPSRQFLANPLAVTVAVSSPV